MSKNNFSNVTEIPGSYATEEQLSMIITRYSLAKKYSNNKDVLEVACGSGIGIPYIKDVAKSVSACDIDPKLVNIAKEISTNIKGVDIKEGDAQNIPYKNKSFDIVIIFEAIYYLKDYAKFFAEVNRVLRSQGLLIISSVNPSWHGFNPSPFSKKYFNLDELNSIINNYSSLKNISSYYGYYNKITTSNFFLSILKMVAVKLNLVPKTMEGKRFLKKMFLGKLFSIPKYIDDKTGKIEKLVLKSETSNLEIKNYKQIYSIIQKN
tara:strand:- start:587 stop:1378 length:792 start_codon:yes stop_codon:yes gene_type:complete